MKTKRILMSTRLAEKFGLLLLLLSYYFFAAAQSKNIRAGQLMGNRFLTFNTVIRVNQIEVARDQNEGVDERNVHTPEKIIAFRKAVEDGFPGAKITWAFSWLALHDTAANYREIRKLVA